VGFEPTTPALRERSTERKQVKRRLRSGKEVLQTKPNASSPRDAGRQARSTGCTHLVPRCCSRVCGRDLRCDRPVWASPALPTIPQSPFVERRRAPAPTPRGPTGRFKRPMSGLRRRPGRSGQPCCDDATTRKRRQHNFQSFDLGGATRLMRDGLQIRAVFASPADPVASVRSDKDLSQVARSGVTGTHR
jgi:hypothetical protein